MKPWHIITGEYPPCFGGVADYTRILACELAKAGEEVHVWAPSSASAVVADEGVQVHSLPGRFGLRALRALARGLNGRHGQILVQYVPHAFGWKAMNLPFSIWLLALRKQSPAVMFHEVAFPISRTNSPRRNALGAVTHLMALLIARAAGRIFVATPGWETVLRPMLSRGQRVEWLPIPSNIPVIDDPEGAGIVRVRYSRAGAPLLGHFGSYDPLTRRTLAALIPAIPADRADAGVLLLGEGSAAFRRELLDRYPLLSDVVCATGMLPPAELSRHLQACDVMIQPYPDGASTRRGSLMACLSHGVPIVTTFGRLTEPLWSESEAVLLAPVDDVDAMRSLTVRLLSDGNERLRLARAARDLYARCFDIRYTVRSLLTPPSQANLTEAVSPLPCESR